MVCLLVCSFDMLLYFFMMLFYNMLQSSVKKKECKQNPIFSFDKFKKNSALFSQKRCNKIRTDLLWISMFQADNRAFRYACLDANRIALCGKQKEQIVLRYLVQALEIPLSL